MDNLSFPVLLGVAITIFGTIAVTWRQSSESSNSLKLYYLADRKLKSSPVVHLLVASSMSLNGLLYHAWLGYTAGIWSVAIQLFWAGSFGCLYLFRKTLVSVLRSYSLLTAVQNKYGHTTARLCAVSLAATFIILVGWELTIAGRIASLLLGVPELLLVVVLLVVVGLYTVRGGLHANATANRFQNVLKVTSFILIAGFSSYFFLEPDLLLDIPYETGNEKKPIEIDPSVSYFKWSPTTILVALGGGLLLLACNAWFSILWQFAEVGGWQSIKAGMSHEETKDDNQNDDIVKEVGTRLMWTSVFVLIAPGAVGAFLGISLGKVENLSPDDIFQLLYAALNYVVSTELGVVVAFAAIMMLTILLTSSMLSTADGFLLGFSYAVTSTSLADQEVFSRIESEGGDDASGLSMSSAAEQDEQEQRVLARGRIYVMVGAALAIFTYVAVAEGWIDLFYVAFLAVVGQMSVVPVVISTLRRWNRPVRDPKRGVVSVIMGLLAGCMCIGIHIGELLEPISISPNLLGEVISPNLLGEVRWIAAAPVAATLAAACVLIRIGPELKQGGRE